MHCGTVAHVVTGDLTIIRDTKLCSLIKKGRSYREQNHINWRVNREKMLQHVVRKGKGRYRVVE